jgi:hypothetical protein
MGEENPMRHTRRWIATSIALAAIAAGPGRALDDTELGFERTPPRLSYVDGPVSFLRPGADDWAPARRNLPLAEGDQLYTEDAANLELQIGPRAYLRAGERTQLTFTILEPDYLQFRVTAGTASVDLRSVSAGQTLEVDTPSAAFTIEHTGYYRVEVRDDGATFVSRRGGRASVTTATGQTVAIGASEEVVATSGDSPTLESYAAPDLDDWDRWNYARTDQQIDAVSARYLPPGVYGTEDLDHYGDWRVVATYGPVWVPRVAAGWAPYSTGSWIYDPFFGWTWLDAAPWGWAPFHYGRWVVIGSYWAWAPGPIVARPCYAPALVAFYAGPRVSVSVGGPFGWVALGWGEPLIPWWGPARFRARPHWDGWGGPRLVNKVVVKKTTVVKVRDIHGYANATHRGAFVAVDRKRFGRGPVGAARIAKVDRRAFRPLDSGDLDVRAAPVSLVGTTRRSEAPPRAVRERPVVARRAPRGRPAVEVERPSAPRTDTPAPRRGAVRREIPQGATRREIPLGAAPPARVVTPERSGRTAPPSRRAPFGKRGDAERTPPSPPPRFERERRNVPSEQRATPPATSRTRPPQERGSRRQAPARSRREEKQRDLPGDPANLIFRPPRAGNADRGSLAPRHGSRGARNLDRGRPGTRDRVPGRGR